MLLLEERGYLSYVDSLTAEKAYASRLRDEFEFRDLFLNAIQEQQWDFMDSMLFLDASPHRLPDQVEETVCTIPSNISFFLNLFFFFYF